MFIKLLNNHGEMILVNPDYIVKVKPYNHGIVLRSENTEELIPDMTVEEFLVKTRELNPDPGKMVTAICDRISHLEDAMASGLSYIGRSVH